MSLSYNTCNTCNEVIKAKGGGGVIKFFYKGFEVICMECEKVLSSELESNILSPNPPEDHMKSIRTIMLIEGIKNNMSIKERELHLNKCLNSPNSCIKECKQARIYLSLLEKQDDTLRQV